MLAAKVLLICGLLAVRAEDAEDECIAIDGSTMIQVRTQHGLISSEHRRQSSVTEHVKEIEDLEEGTADALDKAERCEIEGQPRPGDVCVRGIVMHLAPGAQHPLTGCLVIMVLALGLVQGRLGLRGKSPMDLQNILFESGSSGIVDLWWKDLEPLRSFHFSVALLLLSTYCFASFSLRPLPEPIHGLGWGPLLLPFSVAAVLFGVVAPSERPRRWYGPVIAFLLLTGITFLLAVSARIVTMRTCDHQWTLLIWALVGVSLAAGSVLFVPERRASAWLRKWILLICILTQISTGLSKVMNSPHDWWRGDVLAHHLSWAVAHQSTQWPWASQALLETPSLCTAIAVASLIFELPLSVAALLGLGEFGRFGPVRVLWVSLAFVFNLGTGLLIEQGHGIRLALLLIAVIDLPGKLLVPREAVTSWQEPSLSQFAGVAKATLTAVCFAMLLVWLGVALLWHFPGDDPRWPISSMPMYSMKCSACSCSEELRTVTIQLFG
mmetsp:Transcript_35891/g.78600  ORF Transcript_35891/g.78600 Transcript_35891/m.78600 type:complete len:495 (+) Transcript_35891:74-1558(+)